MSVLCLFQMERKLKDRVMTVFVNLLDLIGLLVAGLTLLLFTSLFVYLEIKKRIENKRKKQWQRKSNASTR